MQAAEALGANVTGVKSDDAGQVLADRITWFMRELKVPNGLKAVGYSSSDIDTLVEGTLPQHRVTKLSPRPAGQEELARLFEDAWWRGSCCLTRTLTTEARRTRRRLF